MAAAHSRRLLEAVGAAVNLREGEAPLVLLVLAHSFLNGVPKTLTNSAATAIFLEQHGAQNLPYAYMASAVVVTLLGFAFVKLGRVLSFATRLQAVLVLIAAGGIGLWLGIAIFGVRRASIVFPVWTEIEWSILPLEFWGLSGQLFNVQQGKRIFTLLGIGELVSSTLLGFMLPAIVGAIGAQNVFLLSAAGAFGSLIVLRKILALAAGRMEAASAEEEPESPRSVETAGRYRRYIRYLFALVSFSFLSAFFLDNIFSDRAEARFHDADRLAGFLGVFWGSCNLAALIFKSGIAGRLLSRYGLALGILALPVLLILGYGAAAVTGGAVLFWIVVATRAVDYVTRDALDGPAGMILYQPLPPALRASAQARADGIVGPLAGGFSGVVLAVLLHVFKFGAAQLTAVGAVCACGWLYVANRLRRDYRTMLEDAVAGRRLKGLSISLDDPATRAVIEKGLLSPRPGEVLYSLGLLEESRSLEPILRRLLLHPEALVRREALLRIERRGFDTALADVARLIEDPSPEVRGAAVRVLASIGDADQAIAFLDHSDPSIRDGALIGLMRSGGVDGIIAAGQRLSGLARAASAGDRSRAAFLLAETGLESFHRPLAALLRDPDLDVRRRALVAAEKLGNSRLWPIICESLTIPAVRAAAGRALASAGEPVLPLLEQELPRSAPELRARIAAVCGRIGGQRAASLLRRMLQGAAGPERQAVLAALAACAWQSSDSGEVRRWLAEEMDGAARTAAAQLDVGADSDSLLQRALAAEIDAARERVLLLLSFVYDSRAVQRARAAISRASGDERALALELIQGMISLDLRQLAGPLLEDLTPAEMLQKLPPQPRMERGGRLAEIAGRDLGGWTILCALHELGRSGAMLTVEKVMILKSVQMFAQTPDEVLAEIASILKEASFPAGQTIFKKGDPGDCMYLIEGGRVRIHDGEHTLTTLGERDIFGELAVLDSEPRSASATAAADTRLFRIDQQSFYDLMADRIEIVRGILRVLCQRVRARNSEEVLAAR